MLELNPSGSRSTRGPKNSAQIFFILIWIFWAILGAVGSSDADIISSDVISFDMSIDTSADLSLSSVIALSPRAYERAEAKRLSAKMCLGEWKIDMSRDIRLLLTCERVDGSRAYGTQLILADLSSGKMKPLHRAKLGDTDTPAVVIQGSDVLVRMIRHPGGRIEGSVFHIDMAAQKLTNRFDIGSKTLERLRFKTKALLKLGGVIEAVVVPVLFERIEGGRRTLADSVTIDLYYALDALIEDGIYRQDGRPVPALANLKFVRMGWEDVDLVVEDGTPLLVVGASYLAGDRGPVLTSFIHCRQDANGRYVPIYIKVAPFMGYDI